MTDRRADRHLRRPRPRACLRCLEVKTAAEFPAGPKGGGRRSSVCWPCTEARAWEHYHRVIAKRSTWIAEGGVRVRRCAKCSKVAPVARGFYVAKKAGGTDHNGNRILKHRYSRYCKRCHNAKSVVQYAGEMADPERRKRRLQRQREASQRYRERHRAKSRAAQRDWKRRLRADPERHARYLEDTRINYRLKREREGKPVMPVKRGMRQPSKRHVIPAKPLAGVVVGLIEREQRTAQALNIDADTTIEHVCRELGISSRTLRRWRVDEQPTAQVGVAEKVLLNAGVEWHEVYPNGDHAAVFLA